MAERSTRILLVDDEQSIQTLLSYPLQKDGYEVVQATDGREALDRFEERPFDLVVLDVMLPKRSGFEVLKQIRADAVTRDLPVMILTAKGQAQDRQIAEELGASSFITKPYANADVVGTVKRLLDGPAG